jgi:hypothetical protein
MIKDGYKYFDLPNSIHLRFKTEDPTLPDSKLQVQIFQKKNLLAETELTLDLVGELKAQLAQFEADWWKQNGMKS